MFLGWLFVFLGILFSAAGTGLVVWGGSWLGYLALWPAASFFVVSAAYLRLGPRVLGKRPDGSLPLVRVLVLLPYFVFTWGIWHLLRLGAEHTYDLVAPDIYLGRLPLRRELPDDVRLIVDLTAEFPRAAARPDGCDYVNLPTLDAFVPGLDECEALVRSVAAHPGPVYIHCAQGHGRSALVAGALMCLRGLASSADDAVARMKRARPTVNLSSSQRAMLGALCARLAPARR